MRSALVFSSLAALTLAFASPAFAQQSPATMPSQGTTPQTQMPAQGQMQQSGRMAPEGQAQKQKLSERDKNFVKEAALGGMAEVELGKLAQQNAQNDDVKQFGSRMVQDHSDINQQLTTILAGKDVTAPTQLDEKHRKTLDKLSKMRGTEFDRAYMREMVEDHDKDVKKFRNEAQHANDADIKAFAQKTLPVLEQHQKLAHDITRSMTAVGSSGQAPGHKNR
jgi:putative membrane protein